MQVTNEKVIVTRRNKAPTEDIGKTKYQKELDIGGIMTTEITDEKREIPKCKEPFTPNTAEVTLTSCVQEVETTQCKKDVIKVGKLDVTDFEKQPAKSRIVYENVTTNININRMDTVSKVP